MGYEVKSFQKARDNRRAKYLRILIIVWLTFSFLMTASYSGNLRAYLLTPDRAKPVDSLIELFESGLPWDMVPYSAVDGVLQHSSPDEPIIKFWKEKENATYDDYIFERVSI